MNGIGKKLTCGGGKGVEIFRDPLREYPGLSPSPLSISYPFPSLLLISHKNKNLCKLTIFKRKYSGF